MRSIAIAIIITLLSCESVGAVAAARGHTHGACDLDMDGDGDMGTAGDCDVCDGDANSDQDEIYVDCDNGDNGDPGTAAEPYKTITYALTQADGPDAGEEDVICVQGTCTEAKGESMPISLNVDGKSTIFTRAKDVEQNEQVDFDYPEEPFGIYCWDTDGDGDYRSDETCTLAAVGGNDEYCFSITSDYFAMAHMTIDGCGKEGDSCSSNDDCPGKCKNNVCSGMGLVTYQTNELKNHWWHHNTFSDVNKDTAHITGNRVFSLFQSQGGAVDDLAIEHNYIPNFAGYFMRGTGGDGDGGSGDGAATGWRLMNNTFTCHGCDNDTAPCRRSDGLAMNQVKCSLDDLFGAIDGMEILNNEADANVSAWKQDTAVGFQAHACMGAWYVINNKLTDFQYSIVLAPDDGNANNLCYGSGQHALGPVYIIGNEFVLADKDDIGSKNVFGIYMSPSDSGGNQYQTIKDALIMNNTLRCETSSDHVGAFIHSELGHDSQTCPGGHAGGEIKIINNTTNCAQSGTFNSGGLIYIDTSGRVCDVENYTIYNNALMGDADCVTTNSGWSGTSLDIDNNAYGTNCNWDWKGSTKTSLSSWQGVSGVDDSESVVGDCTFVDTSSPITDIHLATGDTVCQSAGATRTEWMNLDRDLDPRTAPTDIGSDEVSSGGPPCTEAADCDDGNTCTTDNCIDSDCVNTVNTLTCDDGLYCNGIDTCLGGVCGHTGDPCPGVDGDINCSESCDESIDSCTLNDINGSSCNDGLFCTLVDTCNGSGVCGGTGDPCSAGQSCQEDTDDCSGVATCDWQTSCEWTMKADTDTSDRTRNYRSEIIADYCTLSGTKIRVTAEAETSPEGTPMIDGSSIGVSDNAGCQSGSPPTACPDFDATPTRITWSGSSTRAFTANESVLSDEIDFVFDHTKRHLLHLYMTNREFKEATDTNNRYGNSSSTDETLDSVLTEAGWSPANSMWAISKIETCVTNDDECSVDADCASDGVCKPGVCTANVCSNPYDNTIPTCEREGSLLGCIVNCVMR